jgi:hypothetical protein
MRDDIGRWSLRASLDLLAGQLMDCMGTLHAHRPFRFHEPHPDAAAAVFRSAMTDPGDHVAGILPPPSASGTLPHAADIKVNTQARPFNGEILS